MCGESGGGGLFVVAGRLVVAVLRPTDSKFGSCRLGGGGGGGGGVVVIAVLLNPA